ncbi:hypothetical protein Ddye_004619 [Dipteronia dyeriana]|uniref:Rhodopsin n=1 Tax=Dipteronia dyeriana TaxID=168575 RepID=A0AAD9XV56_9ROSI|nr:hypothetical protein Ddye_004619 [Dipteronia dyeriana]
MSYQRPHNEPYPPPGYSSPYPPPGYPSAPPPPPPPYEGYPPPGYPYHPPPPPPPPRPYEGYQGYFADGYPPGHPQYQHCQYEVEHHHHRNQSDSGCFSFLQGWYVSIFSVFLFWSWDSCCFVLCVFVDLILVHI